MKIQWLGHASFLIQSKQGLRIVTDPFDASVGYKIPNISADIVTISHSHFDHNAISSVKGNPITISREGKTEAKGIVFEGISSYHDEVKGNKRGKNIIFVFTVDEIRICHLGDLGHIISRDLISNVHVLLIPVGGFFTIGKDEAKRIIDSIQPNIIIPMHYKTNVMGSSFPIEPVEPFAKLFSSTEKLNSSMIEIEKANLPLPVSVKILNFA